jgi:hypothetical protein
VRTGFIPWLEWRRDGAPERRRTKLDGNGEKGGLAWERREWNGGSGVWGLKERGWGGGAGLTGAWGSRPVGVHDAMAWRVARERDIGGANTWVHGTWAGCGSCRPAALGRPKMNRAFSIYSKTFN